ncbi:hypothetical protein Pedsa_3831 [Pseudopedobacter saltans DSM 12145]|uniref:LTD domain-containing protein n=1 Tax=Pseudopedobacter saltans (strain ATCC 51119 / DSM 12145 / JCM 21818 / CCUG 39354 / LMG 10337 / NBRC 100064 / NCIMB 13643) TaxID=762903 RepID=F0S786_PSESL|nr:lamin tail domain-containing protein [Pseudopedobacter saltans]ADY54359.1 hypothetical protein Pedsa_3831 [Pseudopedobacter saltans DSM 12145]
MRKFLLFLMLLLHKNAFSQLNDKFDDGNFTTNPAWVGPNAQENFVVENGSLKSNSDLPNTNFFLATANSLALNTVWEFDCNLKFSVSGNNYADIYLISDSENLSGSTHVNGYFVRVGNTGKEISLFKRNGLLANSIKLLTGQSGTVSSSSNNPLRIRVTRNSLGEFTLEWDKSQTGNLYQSEGKVIDKQYSTSNWFGIYIQQSTASFHKKHFFSNFSIKEIELPEIESAHIAKNKLTISFTEDIRTNDIDLNKNFHIKPFSGAIKSVTTYSKSILVEYDKDFESALYQLTVDKIRDLAGNLNSKPLIISFTYNKPYLTKYNDILINEIFANPNPQVDLPKAEFIELLNTTTEKLSLKGFKYSNSTTNYIFGDDYILPEEHLIICAKSDTLEYKEYGRTIGISPWPTLRNDNGSLSLTNQEGTLIHKVQYSDTWYKDNVKKKGGYSLELIDPASICIDAQNFSGSQHPSGGTPGKSNSIYKSNISSAPLSLSSLFFKDDSTVVLVFNKAIDSLKAISADNYISKIGKPDLVKVVAPEFSSVELIYKNGLVRGQSFLMKSLEICDCGVTKLTNLESELIVPSNPQKGKILINEILFNPRAGGKEFVELYNHSDETFDFRELFIAGANAKDSVINIKTISANTMLFKPGTYWVITTDPENIQLEYFTTNPDNFIKVSALPSFNNDKGTVVLLDKDKNRIDQLNYDRNMHFALLKEEKGVSLERTFFNEDTNKPGNFRSATASVGFSTPAYKNSQNMAQNATSSDGIALSTKVLSPDNDGTNDLLSINYQLDQNNYVANVSVYNDEGRLIKKIINNEAVSSSGTWLWDGFDLTQNRVKTGIYILHAELFDLFGKRKNYKTAFSVVSRQ